MVINKFFPLLHLRVEGISESEVGGDVRLDRPDLNFRLDPDWNVVKIVGHPHGHPVGVLEDPVDDELGLDLDAPDLSEVR